MAIERSNDLRAFKGFIDKQLENSEDELPLDETLARWEFENLDESERARTLEAIQSGLDDIDAGRVRPLEEFDREFRLKHGLPPRS